jgi:hypothetical protein
VWKKANKNPGDDADDTTANKKLGTSDNARLKIPISVNAAQFRVLSLSAESLKRSSDIYLVINKHYQR